jgi:outer membrane protein TolC
VAASEASPLTRRPQVKTLYYNVLAVALCAGPGRARRLEDALKTANKRREDGDSAISSSTSSICAWRCRRRWEVPKLESGAVSALEALRMLSGADRKDPIDVKERFLEPVKTKLEPLEHYTGDIYDKSPAWKQIDAGVAAKAEEVKTVEADFFPVFFLTGTFSWCHAPRNDRQLNPFA